MQTQAPGVATSPTVTTCERYGEVRSLTEQLAAPLSAEDQTAQSMPDVSPSKWHRAHTTWFFEEFILSVHVPGYRRFREGYDYLFNSYYEGVGPRHLRSARGVVTRPGIEEVAAYRRHVDAAMTQLLSSGPSTAITEMVDLGLRHEQQHQELLLMDIKHVLSCNVLDPAYLDAVSSRAAHEGWPARSTADRAGDELAWVDHPGGLVDVGSPAVPSVFDNETPRHSVYLQPFALAARPVNCGEVLEFIADGGYERAELWLSDGWSTVQDQEWTAPLYWRYDDAEGWSVFTLAGRRPIDPGEPVCHVSYYEADAIARWMRSRHRDARLPTEFEWEAVAAARPPSGAFMDPEVLHPRAADADRDDLQLFGDVWEWTSSAYLPYPGFVPAAGAVGEYNGKFMVGQHVLRGGACVTPTAHVSATYRNFFPPGSRWQFGGLRLARDLEDR